jgi:hypothetical protein
MRKEQEETTEQGEKEKASKLNDATKDMVS